MAVIAALYLALALAGGGYASEVHAWVSIAVWPLLIVGLGLTALPREFVPRAAVAAGLCLAGLAALTGLSVLWATDDGRVVAELARVMMYLGLFALIVVVSARGSVRLFVAGLAIGLGAVAVLAVASRLVPSLFPEQDLITSLPSVASRLAYPVNYWNGLGACMAVGVVLFLWFGAEAATSRVRAVAVAAVPVALLTIYLSFSRGGAVATLVGSILLVALGRRRPSLVGSLAVGVAGGAALIAYATTKETFVNGPLFGPEGHAEADELVGAILLVTALTAGSRLLIDRPLRHMKVSPLVTRLIVAGCAAIVVLGAVALDPAERLSNLCEAPQNLGQPSAEPITKHLTSDAGTGRCQYWEAALEAFASAPVLGLGADGYEAWWAQHGSLPAFALDAHSLFLENLAELGLAGLALVIGFLLVPAVTGLRRRRAVGAEPAIAVVLAVLGTGVVSASIDWTWEIPAVFLPVLLAAALLTGPATETFPGEGSRYSLGIATLAAGWIAIFLSGIVLLTKYKIDESRDQVRSGNLEGALEDARGGSTVQPWAAAPLTQTALVQELRGDLPNAEAAITDAIERAPEDWRLWLIRSRLKRSLGDEAGATADFDRARQLTQGSPLYFR